MFLVKGWLSHLVPVNRFPAIEALVIALGWLADHKNSEPPDIRTSASYGCLS